MRTEVDRNIFLDENQTLQFLRSKLSQLVPDAELVLGARLIPQIEKLKREKNAIILGHNYMDPVLFNSVPDVVGDSLELSRKAATTDADIIIFCGVRFMAETAKILNPTKAVLLPARKAGCSLASSISADDIRALRAHYPGVPVIAYINTYAEVKAEVDICCTSGNAKQVVESFGPQTVIFLPDEFLAGNVAAETGRSLTVCHRKPDGSIAAPPVPAGAMIGWAGRCEVHEKFTVEDITSVRSQFPDVAVLAHPECPPEVVRASDYAASTSRMVEYVKQSKAAHFLILTECSMGDNIIAENPDKDVLRLCSIRCPHMNEITLADTLRALEENETLITLDEDLRQRAEHSVRRMLEVH
jgi:quinolinate synthase